MHADTCRSEFPPPVQVREHTGMLGQFDGGEPALHVGNLPVHRARRSRRRKSGWGRCRRDDSSGDSRWRSSGSLFSRLRIQG